MGEGGEAEEMAECVGVPASRVPFQLFRRQFTDIETEKFEARDVRWAPDGKGLVLVDRDTFCCAFEVEDTEDGS